ncbi:PH domain-containing protein [Isoptericola sp. NEAU-Y5]|uniref:PH domain-containing protein n=1 Tax=Isoptericola luteus TaxID=2879484 RepID=A0ABS7ZI61_9MICO|nr:PH domain-containing protein [Isoptericola sp. NEAU-Y5]MCA5894707.1 PH domain-containing protein [Isoptericola sp. NEAU-Y5]
MSTADDRDTPSGRPPAGTSRWRPFRPLWGQVSAWFVGVVTVGGSLFVGLVSDGPLGALPATKVSFVLFAAAAAVLLWRLGGVHAVPDADGLTVRNVVRRRRLGWAEVVEVRLGPNDPWVRLDLADGDTLAVMGVQRADGERGMAEARRLRALVIELGEAPDPTVPGAH